MGFLRSPLSGERKPRRPSRLHLLAFLALVYAIIRLLGDPKQPLFEHRHPSPEPPLPVLTLGINTDWAPTETDHFLGKRVRANGTYLDLGDRRTSLPASLLSRFFPAELVAPSCLTQPPPPVPAPGLPPLSPLPVRDDWPGFFGAPWTARVNGTLIAMLQVYAPRNTALAAPGPQFQIYPNYNGQQLTPSFSTRATASFTRGSKAVLYRVFVNGPVRCLDLVVQNGENNGTGHLYYQRFHHYYETDAVFQIQP